MIQDHRLLRLALPEAGFRFVFGVLEPSHKRTSGGISLTVLGVASLIFDLLFLARMARAQRCQVSSSFSGLIQGTRSLTFFSIMPDDMSAFLSSRLVSPKLRHDSRSEYENSISHTACRCSWLFMSSKVLEQVCFFLSSISDWKQWIYMLATKNISL